MKKITRLILPVTAVAWPLYWIYYYYFLSGENIRSSHGASQLSLLRTFFGSLFKLDFHSYLSGSWFYALLAGSSLLTIIGLGGYLIVKKLHHDFKSAQLAGGLLLGLSFTGFYWEQLAIFFQLKQIYALAGIIFLFLIAFKIPEKLEIEPESENKRNFSKVEWGLIALLAFLNFFIFYWALCFPVHYWDGLILYAGYARETFFSSGFGIRVCLQVGDGLGANYPHFYPVTAAALAKIAGSWNMLYSQLIPPVMGILTQLFIYATVEALLPKKRLGLWAVLLYRCIPYAISYNIYVSDYATTICMATGFLYYLTRFEQSQKKSFFLMAAIIAAIAPHVNYLMWHLWFLLAGSACLHSFSKKSSKRYLWTVVILALSIGSTWYIRNIIVTGNPVYAFYHQIFGGKNINPEVLEFCTHEWQSNGDGIGNGLYGNSLKEKIANSPHFFVTNSTTNWKLNPVLIAFGLPGLLLSFFLLRKKRSLLYFQLYLGGMLFYHYCISGLYLYHIITITPVISILGIHLLSHRFRALQYTQKGLILCIAVIPGLAMSVFGFKLLSPRSYQGQKVWFHNIFHRPGLDQWRYWEMAFGEEGQIWRYVDKHLQGKKILSHDNRYLTYPEGEHPIHLDEWEVQPVYKEPDLEKKYQFLLDLGLEYYIFIENEMNMVNKNGIYLRELVGIPYFIEKGYLKKVYDPQPGGAAIYRFTELKRTASHK